MIGLVVFSFALREESQEPNPCNQRLGAVVERISKNENAKIIIVAQWEVARQLNITGTRYDYIVNPRTDGTYLDSQIVWQEAKEYFNRFHITTVIPVAHPFLQLPYVKKIIKNDGFIVLSRHMGKIGFDDSKENTQPWTRGPLVFLWHAIKVKLGVISHGEGKQ